MKQECSAIKKMLCVLTDIKSFNVTYLGKIHYIDTSF